MEKIKDVRLAMIVAAAHALDYLEKRPSADLEEVMKYMVKEIRATLNAKLGGVAAVNYVFNYKQKNIGLTKKQIMQNLAGSTSEILSLINNES